MGTSTRRARHLFFLFPSPFLLFVQQSCFSLKEPTCWSNWPMIHTTWGPADFYSIPRLQRGREACTDGRPCCEKGHLADRNFIEKLGDFDYTTGKERNNIVCCVRQNMEKPGTSSTSMGRGERGKLRTMENVLGGLDAL